MPWSFTSGQRELMLHASMLLQRLKWLKAMLPALSALSSGRPRVVKWSDSGAGATSDHHSWVTNSVADAATRNSSCLWSHWWTKTKSWSKCLYHTLPHKCVPQYLRVCVCVWVCVCVRASGRAAGSSSSTQTKMLLSVAGFLFFVGTKSYQTITTFVIILQ